MSETPQSLPLHTTAIGGKPTFPDFLQSVFSKIELPAQPRLLEYGCGTGEVTRLLGEHLLGRGALIALDASSKAIRAARAETPPARYPQIEFRVIQSETLPFRDGEFDCTLCVRALMHVENPQQVVGELARVLKRNGQFLAVEVDFRSYSIAQVEELYAQARRMNPYIARDLPLLCRESGLTPTDLFPNFIVSREPLTRAALAQAPAQVRTLRPHLRQLERLDLNDYIQQVERTVHAQSRGAFSTLLDVAVLARKL